VNRTRVGILIALGSMGCWDDAIGPAVGPQARFALLTPLRAGAVHGVVQVSDMHLRMLRVDGQTALDTTIAITPTGDSVVVDVAVSLLITAPSSPPTERLEVRAALTGSVGDTLFIAGPDTVDAVASTTPTPMTATFRYVGVGSNAASVVITMTDSVLVPGDTVTLTAAARDNAGSAIAETPLVWSSLDPAVLNVLSPDSGRVTTVGTTTATGRVVARSLTGPVDTVTMTVSGTLQTAGALFVDVDATALPYGAVASIPNQGTLGGVFQGFSAPVSADAPGGLARGIQFNGTSYMVLMQSVGGPRIAPPAGLVGVGVTRSIEVWAFNPAVGDEETLVSWGRRGGPDGSNMSFNYGVNAFYGAVGHWGVPDMGWMGSGGAPVAGRWHHLVYTLDGTTARVYANGVLQTSEAVPSINTHANTGIQLAAQIEPDGVTVTPALRGSLFIAKVRIHDGVLTQAQILDNYALDEARFVGPASIALSSSSMAFADTVGGTSSTTRSLTITNFGTGVLSGLSVGTVQYGPGASGWLTATLGAATAPATLSIRATNTSLSAGTYTATVPVNATPPAAQRTVSVTFSVVSLAAYLNFDTLLLPGVAYRFPLGPAPLNRGLIAEVTPLDAVSAGFIPIVQPEFNGTTWDDALRIQTRPTDPPLRVNVRVHDVGQHPLVTNFNFNASPGVWHGFVLAASAQNRTLVTEITPLDLVPAQIERSVIQPEWNGTTWSDVVRLNTRPQDPMLGINLRAYDVSALPVALSFDTTLTPGVLHGFSLGASSQNRGFVVEVTPLSGIAGILTNYIAPEFDGTNWNDVLRLQTVPADPPMLVNVRIRSTS
jgi:hypothetical protein